MGVLRALNSTINKKAFLVKAKDLLDDTERLSLESVKTSITLQCRYRIGLGILAIVLLIFAGLSTGLILAICSVDQVWLHMKSITATPKEREYIRVITQLKTHGTWMLCSLIICAVACSEYFPFVIQRLFPGPSWIAILVSTFSITIFVELVPQFLIPAQPLIWGYYCRPIIWTCMWLTALVSWPISVFLSHVSMMTNDRAVFTNQELKSFIKYHEKSEKKGGRLGREASRVMIGALNLDYCVIGELSSEWLSHILHDKDPEKATQLKQKCAITSWSLVRTVNIDDTVNNEFIRKIKRWAYSRLPVIGTPIGQQDLQGNGLESHWEGIEIFGYLHLNSLIGCFNVGKDCPLSVRDLPLDPLPMVQVNMPVYSLLNMFENGISKMAIVVPSEKQELNTLVKSIPRKISMCSHINSMDCLCTRAMNFGIRQGSKNSVQTKNPDNDLDGAALTNLNDQGNLQTIIRGAEVIRPIGLITIDDLIGAILQRNSHNGGDILHRCSNSCPNENENFRRVTHHVNDASNYNLTRSDRNTQRRHKFIQMENEVAAIDGADDHNFETLHSHSSNHQKLRSAQVDNPRNKESDVMIDKGKDFANTSLAPDTKRMKLPSNISFSRFSCYPVMTAKNNTFPRQKRPWSKIEEPSRYTSTGSVIPALPKIPQVTPFSYQDCSEYSVKKSCNEKKQIPILPFGKINTLTSLSLPESSPNLLDSDIYRNSSNFRENFGKSKTFHSSSIEVCTNQITDPFIHKASSTSLKEGKLCGEAHVIPPKQLLKNSNSYTHVFSMGQSGIRFKENQVSKYASQTMPRLKNVVNSSKLDWSGKLKDDRTLLHNQWRVALGSAGVDVDNEI